MALGAIILMAIVLLALYYLATKHYTFWENAGVRTLTPPTLEGAIRGTILGGSREMYTFARGEPYIGIIRLNSLAVCIRDPDLIRLVLSKDFSFFHDRGTHFHEDRDPLSANLFNLEGRKWKIIRAKLTPTFTSGRLREMYPLIKQCEDKLMDLISLHVKRTGWTDLVNVFSRCTTDVILSCAFGLQGSALEDPDDIYARMVKRTLEASLFQRLEHILFVMFPSLQKVVPLSKQKKEISDFFVNTLSSTVKAREQTGTKRNDFLDLLMEIRKNGHLADSQTDDDALDSSIEFTDKLMAAQAFMFVIAGADTTSAASSFSAMEIAYNPAVQEKLRVEVDDAIQRHGGLTYDALMSMTYLDQVVWETLRKYPAAETIVRKVTRSYRMPDGRVTLPAGLRVYLHIDGLHKDPKYFPDPERFDPERFSPEATRNREKFVYIPFGEGPRMCIGMRFALLQVKLALASIVSRFELRPMPGVQYPLKLSKSSLLAATEDGRVLVTKRVRETSF